MDTLSVELSQSIFLSKYLSSDVVVKQKLSTSGADVCLFLGQRDFIYRSVFYKQGTSRIYWPRSRSVVGHRYLGVVTRGGGKCPDVQNSARHLNKIPTVTTFTALILAPSHNIGLYYHFIQACKVMLYSAACVTPISTLRNCDARLALYTTDKTECRWFVPRKIVIL